MEQTKYKKLKYTIEILQLNNNFIQRMSELLKNFLLVWNKYNNLLDISIDKYRSYLDIIAKIRYEMYKFTREEMIVLIEISENIEALITNEEEIKICDAIQKQYESEIYWWKTRCV